MTKAWGGINQWQYYSYDADGHRTRRKVDNQETFQIYFDGELLAEYAANSAAANPQKEYGYRNGQLLITAAPLSGGQNVSWTNAVGVSANGNSMTKTAATGWGNAGSSSTQSISSGEGYVEFTASATTTNRFCGLSNGDSNQNYTDVDFAIGPAAGGTIYIYEAGVSRGTFGNYATGDLLRVAVESGMVKYRKNGTLLYTSTVTPTYPLLVDTALYENGATISNVVISCASGDSSGVQWLVTDQLGTPRMIFDQSGSLANVKRHDYLPFGEELAGVGGRTTAQGYTGDTLRQKFTSQERDNETGLDYFLVRRYSSSEGRFTSTDPENMGSDQQSPQSFNAYSYVSNTPLNSTDPLGLWKEVPCSSGQGKCWEVDSKKDTIQSLAKIVGVSGRALNAFLQNPKVEVGKQFDISGFYLNNNTVIRANVVQVLLVSEPPTKVDKIKQFFSAEESVCRVATESGAVKVQERRNAFCIRAELRLIRRLLRQPAGQCANRGYWRNNFAHNFRHSLTTYVRKTTLSERLTC